MARTYKIRTFQNGRNARGEPFINYSLTIPTHIAEKLPGSLRYECKLTSEGILFAPVEGEEETTPKDLPAWAKKNGKPPETPKRKVRDRPQA